MKSLLLLALGLARTVVLGARIEAERIVVSVRPYKREQRRCPVCGRACDFYDMANRGAPRLWRAMDLARSACYLEYAPCRVRCPEHGVRTEAVPWARHGARFTRDFEDWVAWLAVRCTASAVSDVSVNLFFTSFAKQARRSRKGGFTGCANVFSPIPVTARRGRPSAGPSACRTCRLS